MGAAPGAGSTGSFRLSVLGPVFYPESDVQTGADTFAGGPLTSHRRIGQESLMPYLLMLAGFTVIVLIWFAFL